MNTDTQTIEVLADQQLTVVLHGHMLTAQSQALGLWGYSFAELRVAEWMGGRRVRLVDLNGENAL